MITDIVTIISTCGFPIAACCGLAWYVYKLTTAHKEEINKLSEVISNNTRAIERLTREVKKE